MRKNNKLNLLQGLALTLTIHGLSSDISQGALTITINEFNTTTIDFHITGTLESDATGDDKKAFALVAANHPGDGTHTEWMALYRPSRTLYDSASVNGVHFSSPFTSVFTNTHSSNAYGDSISFGATSDLVAGDQIDWHIVATGTIDPSAAGGLKIMTGTNRSTNDWAEFEPVTIVDLTVPEPSGVTLLALSAFVFSTHRRRTTAR